MVQDRRELFGHNKLMHFTVAILGNLVTTAPLPTKRNKNDFISTQLDVTLAPNAFCSLKKKKKRRQLTYDNKEWSFIFFKQNNFYKILRESWEESKRGADVSFFDTVVYLIPKLFNKCQMILGQ